MTAPPKPEFSRPERVDMITDRERVVELEARPAEREALARRFGLFALDSLRADFTVRREHGDPVARGRVTADVVQACSVTGEPVPARIDEPADLRFLPAGPAEAAEIELSADALAVGSDRVTDGSLTLLDLAGVDARTTLSVPKAQPGKCLTRSVSVTGARPGQVATVTPLDKVTKGLVLSGQRVPVNDVIEVGVCNVGAKATSDLPSINPATGKFFFTVRLVSNLIT